MASFDMVIDTDPMAQRLDTVNFGVQSVNASVIAMQSAVIESQESASRKICNNVDNGFFMLIRSGLSQKIAACASAISSNILLMQRLSKDIQRVKATMQSDYNRIYRRYHKEFTTINKNLEIRVHSLDKATFELATTYKAFLNSERDSCATVFLVDEEAAIFNAKSSSASLKSKTQRALDSMKHDIRQDTQYSQQVEHILGGASSSKMEQCFVPAILTQEESLHSQGNLSNVYIPQSSQLGKTVEIVNAMSSLQDGGTEKSVSPKEKARVKEYYTKMVEAVDNQRVADAMMQLFDKSNWSASSFKKSTQKKKTATSDTPQTAQDGEAL